MPETAPHPAESAPIGEKIDVFAEENPAETIDVHQLAAGDFQAAVDRIGEANQLDLSEGRPVYEGPTPQSADVVTAGTTRHRALQSLVAATAVSAALVAGVPGKVAESFKSENTGAIAAGREASTDNRAKFNLKRFYVDKSGQVYTSMSNQLIKDENGEPTGIKVISVKTVPGSDGKISVQRRR